MDKSKHIYNSLTYKQREELYKLFPPLKEVDFSKETHYRGKWRFVPKELRSDLGRVLRLVK